MFYVTPHTIWTLVSKQYTRSVKKKSKWCNKCCRFHIDQARRRNIPTLRLRANYCNTETAIESHVFACHSYIPIKMRNALSRMCLDSRCEQFADLLCFRYKMSGTRFQPVMWTVELRKLISWWKYLLKNHFSKTNIHSIVAGSICICIFLGFFLPESTLFLGPWGYNFIPKCYAV